MKKVNIIIDAVGGVKFDAEGFNGMGCTEATKVFEDVFAGKHGERNHKNEYFMAEKDTVERQRV